MSLERAMPESTPADEVLIARMVARDQEALATLYDRYRCVLFSLALRILRDRAEAEEALADVFLQAWRQARGFEARRGSVGAWLVTLCRSRAIDR
ncbi:MAG TPA: sigma factor, partial [Candidatus Polarisedimenticolia bacterium]|nr:sigma factor [Candidatus Polarisedimenticolia bacterium]